MQEYVYGIWHANVAPGWTSLQTARPSTTCAALSCAHEFRLRAREED